MTATQEMLDDREVEEQRMDKKLTEKNLDNVVDRQIEMYNSMFDLLNPKTSRC